MSRHDDHESLFGLAPAPGESDQAFHDRALRIVAEATTAPPGTLAYYAAMASAAAGRWVTVDAHPGPGAGDFTVLLTPRWQFRMWNAIVGYNAAKRRVEGRLRAVIEPALDERVFLGRVFMLIRWTDG